MKDIVIKNYKYLLLAILLIVINIFWCFEFDSLTKNSLVWLLIVSTLVGIILSFIINYMDKKKFSIEKKYLILGSIIGSIFLIIIPISKVPDEFNHFLRTYEIVEGNIISKQDKKTKQGGNYLPKNINVANVENFNELKGNFFIKESKEKQFIAFSNTALYSPICYLPQSLGILIGKLFNTSIIIQAYLGRITNFIIFMVIMYFSIKILPFKKSLLFLIAMLPITIQEGISLSPDALTIAMSSLLISFVMYMKYTKKGLINTKEKIIMIILPIVLAMCKIVYLPLCLLLFLIPKERFGTLKKKNIFILSLAIITIILNLVWTSKASIFLEANLHGSSSSDQIKFIISNPLQYVTILLRTFNAQADFHIFSMLGRQLSYFNVEIYAPYIYVSLILMILMILGNSKDNKKIDSKSRALMVFCFISTMLLIFTSIYIQWSSYMLEIVDGVQGRYYIPIILLLGIILSSIFKIEIKENLNNKYIILFIIFENIMALISFVGIYFM